MLQLLVDERLLVFGGQTVRTIGRNFMFLGTDALFTLALVSVVRSGTGKAGAKARAVDWRIVGAAVFTNWAMFQLVFADFATIGLSQ